MTNGIFQSVNGEVQEFGSAKQSKDAAADDAFRDQTVVGMASFLPCRFFCMASDWLFYADSNHDGMRSMNGATRIQQLCLRGAGFGHLAKKK